MDNRSGRRVANPARWACGETTRRGKNPKQHRIPERREPINFAGHQVCNPADPSRNTNRPRDTPPDAPDANPPRRSGASPRRSGVSPRRSGASPRRSGVSPRRSGASPRRSGSLAAQVGESHDDINAARRHTNKQTNKQTNRDSISRAQTRNPAAPSHNTNRHRDTPPNAPDADQPRRSRVSGQSIQRVGHQMMQLSESRTRNQARPAHQLSESGTRNSEWAISSIETSRNVSTFADFTNRAGRYMSQTQASPIDTS